MDLSTNSDSVGHNVSADAEAVKETVESADACLDSSMSPGPASYESSLASFQVEAVAVPVDCSSKTYDSCLNGTEETPDVSDAEPVQVETVQVETVDVVEQPELILKPGHTEAACDSEESSQFSTAAVADDDNQLSVWPTEINPFGERSEERGSDGGGAVQQTVEDASVGVRDSGDESQQLSWEPGSRSQSPMSLVIQLNEDSECSLPPGDCGPTNFGMKLSRLVRGVDGEPYISGVGGHVVAAEDLEDSSRCSQDSERLPDEPDLFMEVEMGSTASEAVSVQNSSATLHPGTSKASSTSSRKSSGRLEDRNRSRIRKRVMVETAAEAEDGHEEMLQVFEYQWPLNDKSAEWFLLQEHISEFLGVVSFKRKYPDIYRRAVDIHERQFLQDSKVVTEMQCDLGLTVLKADEVYDIMERDYPEKFKEYSSIIKEREQQQKAMEPPTEKTKLETLVAKSVKSAAEFNASLMRELRQERRAYFDLQTFELHYPRGRMTAGPPVATKVGRYPIAVVPGQFQDYYRRYTPAELRELPLNTVMNERREEVKRDSTDEQTDAAAATADVNVGGDSVANDDKDATTVKAEAASPVAEADEGANSSSVTDAVTETRPDTAAVDPNPAATTAAKVKRLLSCKKQAVEPEVEKVKCVSCGQSDKNKFDAVEEMICCAVCSSSGHPSCLELTPEMIPIIKSYAWQCMECKSCVKCMNPHDEDKMMFCDHCDRGYHTFCVGLKIIPAGRWECPSCAPATTAPPKPKRGRPFKYPRPVTQAQTPTTTTAAAAAQQ